MKKKIVPLATTSLVDASHARLMFSYVAGLDVVFPR
jgi:hypothetical protein